MVTRPGLIAPEIAERYDRAQATIQRIWTQHPDWPAPVGRRGRWNEYDAEQVDEAVRRLFLRDQHPDASDPEQLLTVDQIAALTGLAASTIRSDISRGRWPAPDEDKDGVKRWKRRSVDTTMAARRGYRRRTEPR